MDPGENSDSDSDMGVDETSDTPIEVNNTQDSSVERTRRGAVQCKRITKMREGELLNVQYNEDGQRIGEGGKDLASYSGLLAESRIFIVDYENWHAVGDEVRDLLWDTIKAKFNLTEDKKKGVVSDIGEKWKEFKSRLTRPDGPKRKRVFVKVVEALVDVEGMFQNRVEIGEFDFDGEEESGLEFDEEYEVGVSSVSHKSSELPLECLSVSGLGVGDCGLGWLWRSCTKLKRLELRSCEGIGDGNSFTSFIKCLKALQELEIRTCRTIVDRILLLLAEHCNSLNSLLLYDGGSREGPHQFISRSRSNIQKLDLRLPLDLENNHLLAVAENIRGLISLRLQSCLVTSEGLKTIGSTVSVALEELALINCDVVKREPGLLTTLGQNLKGLKKLDLSYNETLVDMEFVSMVVSCRGELGAIVASVKSEELWLIGNGSDVIAESFGLPLILLPIRMKSGIAGFEERTSPASPLI
ncbi:hypothetical protein IFM89_006840 [Coptis chinensis]|uniref:Uncharacterized protein n=1 Tax=Coptis chinensis TaxID=261450 RepID=A0A835LZH9_9MAGN|nr:hypothetical protein IFM89_006840 [Coptis chinensis]